MLVALSSAVFLGFAALAIDIGFLQHYKRRMQTAADAGALGAGTEIYRIRPGSITSSALAATAGHGFTDGSGSVVVTVNHPPATGPYAGNATYVEVVIRESAPTLFGRVLGVNPSPVSARAVAGVGAQSTGCLYALDRTIEEALRVNQSSLNAPNCRIVVNSGHNQEALLAESNAHVTAQAISITGSASNQGSTVTPAPTTQVPPEPDPLAHLVAPPVEGCGSNLISGDTYNPGVYYSEIQISGGTKTFNPGLYVLKEGMVVNEATVTGSGVTFYVTGSKPLRIQSCANATLSAPTSGPQKDVLFFYDRSASSDNDPSALQSGTSTTLTGISYFPTQRLVLGNGAGGCTCNETINGPVVARTLEVAGTCTVNVNHAGTGPPGTPTLERLTLVE